MTKFNRDLGYEEAMSGYRDYLYETIWSQTLIEGQTLIYHSVLKYFDPLQSLRKPLNEIFSQSENISIYTLNLLNCLKAGWQLITSWLEDPLMPLMLESSDLILLNWKSVKCEQIKPGLRTHPVRISGSRYLPEPVITIKHYENIVASVNQIDDRLNAILVQFAYLCKQQLFNDGNKRSALLVANYQLIKSGLAKQMFVPANLIKPFKKVLIDYYEDEQKLETLINFLKTHCLKFTTTYLQYQKQQKQILKKS